MTPGPTHSAILAGLRAAAADQKLPPEWRAEAERLLKLTPRHIKS